MEDRKTKDHLLDCAEKLFAKRSFASVSIREITAEAGTNMASVNYYFGSKDDMVVAVFERKVRALNSERLDLLAAAEAKAGEGQPPLLRDIFYALFAPTVLWSMAPDKGLAPFVQFLQRCRSEGSKEMQVLVEKHANHLKKFVPAIKRAQPNLSEEEIYWRMFSGLGAMNYSTEDFRAINRLSSGACKFDDPEVVIKHLVDFAVAGFDMP